MDSTTTTEPTPAPETLDQIQARHRKEQRDLQGRITSKKKNATKKTRKGVNDECERLERELKDRQAGEIAALDGGNAYDQDDTDEESQENEVNGVTEALASTKLDTKPAPAAPAEPAAPKQKGKNRQKARLARRAAEAEQAAEEAAAEAANMPDKREVERGRMKASFKQHGLVEHQIAPDGHCLFSAVADQLSLLDVEVEEGDTKTNGEGEAARERAYKAVRRRAAAWMEEHPDDFEPFLEEGLEGYVAKIRDTAEWGGQLELAALANAYGVRIRVVQDGRTEVIEPNGGEKDKEAWLAYYRHGFGLGEHYNSLRKATT